MLESQLKKLTGSKTKLIDSVISTLEQKVSGSQRELLRTIVEDLVDKMDTKDGKILNTSRNKRLLVLLDDVYSQYATNTTPETIKTIIDGVQQIVNFNNDYFSVFNEPAQLAPINKNVSATLNAWLGLTDKGGVAKNGYLDTLIKDPAIKNEIRNQLATAIITQKGYTEVKKDLGTYVTGGSEGTGALQKYYRNFVYDTFSQVDRANNKLIADGLKLNYALYEGGLIETSRKFCIIRNGKVFTRAEIAEFDPPTAKPPGYNPFTDLGGYGCRHHLNWIPDALAFIMRPDLKGGKPVEVPPAAAAPKKVEAPAKKPEPPVEKVPAAKVPKGATSIDKIKQPKDFELEIFRRFRDDMGLVADVRVDFDKLPLPRAIRYAKQITSLLTEYKPFTGYKSIDKIIFESKAGHYGRVVRSSGTRLEEINFGHQAGKEYTRIFDRNSKDYREKSRVDPENLEVATVTHEFAHVIGVDYGQPELLDARVIGFWPQMKKLKRAYTTELNKLVRFNYAKGGSVGDPKEIQDLYLGSYASTNIREFMAEAFTEYKLSSNPSKYAVLAGKLIDKHFKR